MLVLYLCISKLQGEYSGTKEYILSICELELGLSLAKFKHIHSHQILYIKCGKYLNYSLQVVLIVISDPNLLIASILVMRG